MFIIHAPQLTWLTPKWNAISSGDVRTNQSTITSAQNIFHFIDFPLESNQENSLIYEKWERKSPKRNILLNWNGVQLHSIDASFFMSVPSMECALFLAIEWIFRNFFFDLENAKIPRMFNQSMQNVIYEKLNALKENTNI